MISISLNPERARPMISISLNPDPAVVRGALTLDSMVLWVTDRRGDHFASIFPDSDEGRDAFIRAKVRAERQLQGEAPGLRHWLWSRPMWVFGFRLSAWPGGVPEWLADRLAPTEDECHAAWLAEMIDTFGHGGI